MPKIARDRLRQRLWLAPAVVPVGLAALALTTSHPASAVPAYTDQTGQPCQACHVGGFGPQLTPFGREFKIGGYTLRVKKSIPISVMAVASYVNTKADQNPPPSAPPGITASTNNNVALDQASLFIAGGLGKHFGSFTQITYDGIAKQWHWDDMDLRAVTHASLFGKDTILGVSLNNDPAVEDAWNTNYAWYFPYTTSALAPSPGTSPLLNGAVAQEVMGLTAYAWIDKKLYLEAGAYTTPKAGTLQWLGVDPAGGPGDISGLAPYGRLTWQSDLAGGTFEVGATAFKAAIHPGRDRTVGLTDHYTDLGVDASWLKQFGRDTLTINSRYTHETANLQASCALGSFGNDPANLGCAHYKFHEFRGDIGYSFHQKVMLTVGGFTTSGSTNPNVFGPGGAGYATNFPDSTGATAQLDFTPWGDGSGPIKGLFNFRTGIQYTAYGKFDGTSTGASDNNTLRIFTWAAF